MVLISEDKMRHIHGVAEYMYKHAIDYNLEDKKDELYVLGLLHDIGYIIDGKDGHEVNGYKLLSNIVNQDWILQAIKWHGSSPEEYCKYFGFNNLENIPKYMLLLWEADLHIGPNGEYMEYEERLKDIAIRNTMKYGSDPWDKIGKSIVKTLYYFGRE